MAPLVRRRCAAGAATWLTEPVEWLTLPDAAELLDLPITRVRQLIRDHKLLAERRDGVLFIPADFIVDGEVLKGLPGLLTLLLDARYEDDEAHALALHRGSDPARGTPVAALTENRSKRSPPPGPSSRVLMKDD